MWDFIRRSCRDFWGGVPETQESLIRDLENLGVIQ